MYDSKMINSIGRLKSYKSLKFNFTQTILNDD